jgi:carboxyl-terminal processing protease
VVITNRGTAAGAELVAAALLDNKRAEVVGERTYGDAAQRKAITMEDGSAVILAVAKYYSPKDKAIQDHPVAPTHAVAELELPVTDDDDATPTTPTAQPQAEKKPDADALLKRAVEVLNGSAVKAGR